MDIDIEMLMWKWNKSVDEMRKIMEHYSFISGTLITALGRERAVEIMVYADGRQIEVEFEDDEMQHAREIHLIDEQGKIEIIPVYELN